MTNSFETRRALIVGNRSYTIYSLEALEATHNIQHLPYSIKILLENLLRHEDGNDVREDDINAILHWNPQSKPDREIAFNPARVLMQDFTGVPAIVDLAAMRDAMAKRGGDPKAINPLIPVELVIDHSVQVDHFASEKALEKNTSLEFQRNRERYEFLRWGQAAFDNLKIVPPGIGIVHQVNLEYLARTVFTRCVDGAWMAYPDTVVGTDSHTTMINGLGILGWGVGGIEAEAAMLGQPISMLLPEVVGFKLTGALGKGIFATDLVLTIVEMLREKGVVGKFVEFYGSGLEYLSLADRATIANMAPEYGATCGIFPIDGETIRYLKLSGRSDEDCTLIERYAKHQRLWRNPAAPDAKYNDGLELDIGEVESCLAGPKRPQDRIVLGKMKGSVQEFIQEAKPSTVQQENSDSIQDGSVVIAAITSCTNTSNPSVMIGAGLLAKKALAHGLKTKPWVKTSLAPGSKVVKNYLDRSNLSAELDQLGFQVVGYGCTTCIGNSGPLPKNVSDAIRDDNLMVASVISGNRNFEGRVHAEVKMNFLASPPLVVAYALAGTTNIDLTSEPIAANSAGEKIYLRDIWPSQQEITEVMQQALTAKMYRDNYAEVYTGDEHWQKIAVQKSDRYQWNKDSTYIRKPDYFSGSSKRDDASESIQGGVVLAMLGDSVTTDHISPAGAIKADAPAGEYLRGHSVPVPEFNSYGSRRGNHEVMMRGTFANIRLKNKLVPDTEGCWTVHHPSGEKMSIYDAAICYQKTKTPLIVLAGREYGTGSSRDWAAKGVRLLGVVAVIAESFERIHRSNLLGMGILPIVYETGENAASLGLTGKEKFSIRSIKAGKKSVDIEAQLTNSSVRSIAFRGTVCIDTPKEWEYYQSDGILPYVLGQVG